MQCPSCRSFNRVLAKFCGECGAQLVQNATLKPQATALIIGEALGIQHRPEFGGKLQVCAFRVERLDVSGNRLPPVPVEMRGWFFTGVLNEADRVAIKSSWQTGRTLRVRQLRNLTTGGQVVARPIHEPLLLIVAAFILYLGLIAIFMAQGQQMRDDLRIEHENAVATMEVQAQQRKDALGAERQNAIATLEARRTTTQRNQENDIRTFKTTFAENQASIRQYIDTALGADVYGRSQDRVSCVVGYNSPCPTATPILTPTRQAP